MTTLTHLSIGYLIARQVVVAHVLPPELTHQITSLSMLSAVLPDIDTVMVWKILRHRKNSITHYPVFWLILITPAVILFLATQNRLFFIYTLISGLNIMLHLFMDTFSLNDGIRWFWPFTKKEYNFIKVTPVTSVAILFQRAITHPMTLIEVIICGITLYVRLQTGIR